MNSHHSQETTNALEMLLKTVQKSILKKEQDQHFMQVRENFLDSKIRINLDDLVIACMCLPKKGNFEAVCGKTWYWFTCVLTRVSEN